MSDPRIFESRVARKRLGSVEGVGGLPEFLSVDAVGYQVARNPEVCVADPIQIDQQTNSGAARFLKARGQPQAADLPVRPTLTVRRRERGFSVEKNDLCRVGKRIRGKRPCDLEYDGRPRRAVIGADELEIVEASAVEWGDEQKTILGLGARDDRR